MAKDTIIVTTEGEKETVPKLSNGTTFNDLVTSVVRATREVSGRRQIYPSHHTHTL